VSAGVVLLTVAGLLIGFGLLGLTRALRGRPGDADPVPRRSRQRPRITLTPLHGAAVTAGVVVLVVTGWPVAALAVAAGVVFVPGVLGGASRARRSIAVAEGLADWARRLSDLIASGAAGSTRDALRRSATSAPAVIAGPVQALVTRMGPQGIEVALRRFAAEIADPAADKIAGVLILRERNGGPGLADVLAGLAADLDERCRMVREVEAERAKPRANMRTIVIVTALLMLGMLAFAREFLSAYSTPLGQVLLAAVAAVFAVALRWMTRLSTPPAEPRVLTDPVGSRP
jgi:hypothetical protein